MTTAQRRLSGHSATNITQFLQKPFAPNSVVQFRIRERMVKCASVCTMAEFSISSSVVRSKMPELDTLRGIAVLLVLFFHGFNLVPIPHEISSTAGRLWVVITSTGWMGVNLFFVLSGFLITGILIESRETPNYFKRFYFRRALRILPAYYAILLVLLLVTYFGLVDRRVGWPFIGLSFIYLANVTPLFGVAAQYSTLWSLAVEEHFYLLWPAAVRYVSRRKLLYTCLAIIIACPVRAPCTMCAATITVRHTLGWWPIPWLAALSWQY